MEGKTMGYGRKSFDIAGYTYRAANYCPVCVLAELPTGEGETFDGWADATDTMPTEDNLDELALAFGIDRYDERSYDSDEFPKVVFVDQVEDWETCDRCGNDL